MSDQNPTPTGPPEPADETASAPDAFAAPSAPPEPPSAESAAESVVPEPPESMAESAAESPAEAVVPEPPAEAAAPPPPPPPPAAAPPPPPPPPPSAAPPPPPPPPSAAPPPPPPPTYAAPPPPPPPGAYAPPGAYPVPAGAPLSVGDAISYGWKGFTANVGSVLLIVLVVVVVGGALNWLASITDNGFLSFLFSLIGFVVSFFLGLGVIRAALTITDGQKPNVGELFQGEGVAQYALASIVLGLGFALLNFFGLITIVLLPVTFVATLVLGFFVQFFGYSILDENVGAFDGIRRSFDVVKSHFGELLLLWLAAVGINILGAILCGVGLLVTLPVTAIAWAYAWRRLTNGRVAALA